MTVTHEAKPIPEATPKTRVRRTADQLVADLEARIASIKARAKRKQARGNPAIRHTVAAVRSMDKAATSTADAPLRKSLEEARGALTAWLLLNGIAIPTARSQKHTVDLNSGDSDGASIVSKPARARSRTRTVAAR